MSIKPIGGSFTPSSNLKTNLCKLTSVSKLVITKTEGTKLYFGYDDIGPSGTGTPTLNWKTSPNNTITGGTGKKITLIDMQLIPGTNGNDTVFVLFEYSGALQVAKISYDDIKNSIVKQATILQVGDTTSIGQIYGYTGTIITSNYLIYANSKMNVVCIKNEKKSTSSCSITVYEYGTSFVAKTPKVIPNSTNNFPTNLIPRPRVWARYGTYIVIIDVDVSNELVRDKIKIYAYDVSNSVLYSVDISTGYTSINDGIGVYGNITYSNILFQMATIGYKLFEFKVNDIAVSGTTITSISLIVPNVAEQLICTQLLRIYVDSTAKKIYTLALKDNSKTSNPATSNNLLIQANNKMVVSLDKAMKLTDPITDVDYYSTDVYDSDKNIIPFSLDTINDKQISVVLVDDPNNSIITGEEDPIATEITNVIQMFDQPMTYADGPAFLPIAVNPIWRKPDAPLAPVVKGYYKAETHDTVIYACNKMAITSMDQIGNIFMDKDGKVNAKAYLSIHCPALFKTGSILIDFDADALLTINPGMYTNLTNNNPRTSDDVVLKFNDYPYRFETKTTKKSTTLHIIHAIPANMWDTQPSVYDLYASDSSLARTSTFYGDFIVDQLGNKTTLTVPVHCYLDPSKSLPLPKKKKFTNENDSWYDFTYGTDMFGPYNAYVPTILEEHFGYDVASYDGIGSESYISIVENDGYFDAAVATLKTPIDAGRLWYKVIPTGYNTPSKILDSKGINQLDVTASRNLIYSALYFDMPSERLEYPKGHPFRCPTQFDISYATNFNLPSTNAQGVTDVSATVEKILTYYPTIDCPIHIYWHQDHATKTFSITVQMMRPKNHDHVLNSPVEFKTITTLNTVFFNKITLKSATKYKSHTNNVLSTTKQVIPSTDYKLLITRGSAAANDDIDVANTPAGYYNDAGQPASQAAGGKWRTAYSDIFIHLQNSFELSGKISSEYPIIQFVFSYEVQPHTIVNEDNKTFALPNTISWANEWGSVLYKNEVYWHPYMGNTDITPEQGGSDINQRLKTYASGSNYTHAPLENSAGGVVKPSNSDITDMIDNTWTLYHKNNVCYNFGYYIPRTKNEISWVTDAHPANINIQCSTAKVELNSTLTAYVNSRLRYDNPKFVLKDFKTIKVQWYLVPKNYIQNGYKSYYQCNTPVASTSTLKLTSNIIGNMTEFYIWCTADIEYSQYESNTFVKKFTIIEDQDMVEFGQSITQ